jgi:hypothetical protein
MQSSCSTSSTMKIDFSHCRSNVASIAVSMHSRASSDRTIRSLPPTLTPPARFGGRNNIKASSDAPAVMLSASDAIRLMRVGKIASKARAYGWKAWGWGSASVPTVRGCPKNLQSADNCLNCWQVAGSSLHQQRQDVMHPAFCLK